MIEARAPEYELVFGDELNTVHGLHIAQEWMLATVREMQQKGQLPAWRGLALEQMVRDMPRAGFSFTIDGVGLVAVRRV